MFSHFDFIPSFHEHSVIPAQAGIFCAHPPKIPGRRTAAFAGMTVELVWNDGRQYGNVGME